MAALLAGGTIAQAAKQAGAGRRTVERWCEHDAEFKAELQRRREEMRRVASQRLTHLVAEAVDTVRELLASPDDNVRLRAAQTVLKAAGVEAPPAAAPAPAVSVQAVVSVTEPEELAEIVSQARAALEDVGVGDGA